MTKPDQPLLHQLQDALSRGEIEAHLVAAKGDKALIRLWDMGNDRYIQFIARPKGVKPL